MQRVAGGGGDEPLVIVDYAHTANAIEQALKALRPQAAARGGRLWIVFGAGGDRDPGKRAPMGAVAARLADHVVLTSDNPRSEDPAAIVAGIAAGARGGAETTTIVDRDRAIAHAVAAADARDVVLIAGKGHEATQEAGGIKRPFSDVAHARQALAARRGVTC
jgi:UDP-N-acetylmuramoyl-L-alanyl-D-glutamate--2,6-diaminopimelate ligase